MICALGIPQWIRRMFIIIRQSLDKFFDDEEDSTLLYSLRPCVYIQASSGGRYVTQSIIYYLDTQYSLNSVTIDFPRLGWRQQPLAIMWSNLRAGRRWN